MRVPPLAGLERCPLDQLLPRAVEVLRSASLDELAALMLSQRTATTLVPTAIGRRPLSAATRVDDAVREWQARHGLTDAETDVLRLAARGEDRATIAKTRRASPMTVKTQIRALIKKVKATSLHVAVERLLRDAMGR